MGKILALPNKANKPRGSVVLALCPNCVGVFKSVGSAHLAFPQDLDELTQKMAVIYICNSSSDGCAQMQFTFTL